jgi:DNA-binding GntR family transcriptional regulator
MKKSGIRGAAFGVYSTLLMIEARPTHRWPKTLRELADECGKSTATLGRALRHLERHGWITRTRGGGKDNRPRSRHVSACRATAGASASGRRQTRNGHATTGVGVTLK